MNKYNFILNSTLASNSPADPEDTLNVKKKLNQFGFMDVPSYGLDDIPDKPMFDGIKKFQAAKKLKVDGVMKPGGETEAALNKAGQTQTGSKPGYFARKAKPPVKPDMQTSPKPDTPVKPPVEGGPTPRPTPTPAPSPAPITPKPKDPRQEAAQADLSMQGKNLLKRLIEIAKQDKSMTVLLAQFAGSIGIGKENRPEDILKLRKILDEYFAKKGEERDPEKSKSSEVDPDLVFDIQRYQKANNLKVDGKINPGGETEKSMQSHPGKPGPDLPVVMPGPGEGQDENCTEISQRLSRSYEEKKELEFKIKGLQSKAEENVSEAKSIKEIASIASDADVILKAAVGLSSSQLLSQLSAAMGEFVYRLSLLSIGLYTVKAILAQAKVINNDINSYKSQLSDLESEIAGLQDKAMKFGCKL